MKKLVLGALALAAGIYAERKYKVSDIIISQTKKVSGRFGSDTDSIDEEGE